MVRAADEADAMLTLSNAL